jgi:curli biogenesis system outer membrane secretion channel CsgG
MKNANPLALILFALLLNGRGLGDSWAAEVRPAGGPNIEEAQAQPYDGPKARVAVADFEDKMSSTGQYRAEYGRGMADMLATALFNTNRYIVLERQKLSYVLAEQDLGASGRVKRQSAAAIGELEGAELLVVAGVTGFDPGVSGGGGNLGVLGSFFGGRAGAVGSALGSIAGGFRTAHIAIDLRLIDTKTGRVVAANSVEGSASDYSGSFGVANTPISGALGGFAKTPMEKAIRDVIQASVAFVVSKTPAQYYRAGAMLASPAPVPEMQAAPPMQVPQAQTGFAPAVSGAAPQSSFQTPADFASQPQQPPAATAALRSITTDKNPKLIAELTEVRKRGAVVSIVITVRNNGTTKERFDYQQAGTHLLDYSDGKKYDLVSGIQGRRSTTLGPSEQVVIRAMFKAPPKSDTVAVVVDEIGTFEDVSLGQSPSSTGPPVQAPQASQVSIPAIQPGATQQPTTYQQQPALQQPAAPFQQTTVTQQNFGQQPGAFPQQPGLQQPGAFPQQVFPAQSPNQQPGSFPAQGFSPQPGFPPQPGFGGVPVQGGAWSWPPQGQPWPVQPGPQEVVAPPDLSSQPPPPGVPSGGSQPDWLKPGQPGLPR